VATATATISPLGEQANEVSGTASLAATSAVVTPTGTITAPVSVEIVQPAAPEEAEREGEAQGTVAEPGEPAGIPPTGLALGGGVRPLLVVLLVLVGIAGLAGANRRRRRA
jgi:hypothetical protein